MANLDLQFADKRKYDHVLDIGVGNGATTKYISTHFFCNSIIGIDISEKAIEQAKTKNLENNIRFEKRDIKETQYPSESFELICAFQNHFHWEDLHQSFLEIKRIMSKDGILL
ncbi:class I SAM-dependent methyltransferase [Lactococcus piscium]|uniref:Putative S-adenosylmethionine-dependent methyltransferase n=1 Tax=Pseudolactococcus piscium MKFS47 TaxID=297352 RepID=A0A0D6DUS3_9LACT|nr:class I SAM-dependent methyltransferase [Lactococcus piscium]CEN27250.1 Putative S-adenosylmethionine-dependent methyltransferase [Lactococcus piscium MKFS47]